MSDKKLFCYIDDKAIEDVPIHLPSCSYSICSEHLFKDIIKNDCIFYEHFILGKNNDKCTNCDRIQSSDAIKCLICENHEYKIKEVLEMSRNKDAIKEFILNKKFDKLIQVLNEQESIKINANNYIFDIYKNFINKIDLRRELLKKEIETKIDKYYSDLIGLIKADQEKTLKKLEDNLISLNIDKIKQEIFEAREKIAKENSSKQKNKLIDENIKKCENYLNSLNNFEEISYQVENYDLVFENQHLDVDKLFGKLELKKGNKKFNDKKLSETINGVCSKTLEGHSHYVYCVEILDNNEIVSCSGDKTIKIWNKETGNCIRTFEAQTREVTCLTCLNKDEILSGSYNSIKKWNKNNGNCIKTVYAHDDFIWSIKILDNGNIVSASDDKNIKIWDKDLDIYLKTLLGHTAGVTCLDVLQNNELLSGSKDKTIKLWNIETENCIRTFHGHTGEVWSVKTINLNEMLSGSADTNIKLWNINTGECLKTFQGHTGRVRNLIITDTEEIISSGKEIKFWDLKSGECKKTINVHNTEIRSLKICNDRQTISSSFIYTIKIWS